MKDWIYNCFVNKVPGIRERYIEKKHKCKNYLLPILYAFWLNIRYYIFFDKNLKFSNRFFPYERKKLYCKDSESSLSKLKSPEFFAKYLSSYDVISFDIFDTLIFRCLSDPKDLFYFLGAEFNYIDFKKIRTESEEKARKIKYKNSNTGEIKLEEIWEVVEYETGIPKKYGIEKELEFEKKFCFANPYMIKVTKKLLELKKKIVITSDTYLDEKYIKMLLKKCGYDEFYEYFISCEYGKSKADGSLYDKMKEKMGYSLSYIHIGDNKISDIKMAVSHGIKSIHYKNVNEVGENYRAYDMSCMTGSFYRGLVNSHRPG